MNSPDYNYPPPPLFTPEQSAAIGEAFDRVFTPEPFTTEEARHE